MQGLMVNGLMIDMWKNISEMSTMKWMQDVLSHDTKPEQVGLKALGFQKQTMDKHLRCNFIGPRAC